MSKVSIKDHLSSPTLSSSLALPFLRCCCCCSCAAAADALSDMDVNPADRGEGLVPRLLAELVGAWARARVRGISRGWEVGGRAVVCGGEKSMTNCIGFWGARLLC